MADHADKQATLGTWIVVTTVYAAAVLSFMLIFKFFSTASQRSRPSTDGPKPYDGIPCLVYQRRPIRADKQETRILHIVRPPSGIKLQGMLECISLERGSYPDYEAVSWTWGDTSDRVDVVIDGVDAQLPRKAVEALRGLCIDLDPTRRAQSVWFDIVCIDQQSVGEKDHQVSHMHEIYAKARRVLVWLGPAVSRTPAALRSIQLCFQQCRASTSSFKDLNAVTMRPNGMEGQRGSLREAHTPLPDCDWPALNDFFSARWFTRLWMVCAPLRG
jgi:hypothetical protein